jgi:hypothetical protein
MKRADLPRTTDEQLMARFVEIALAQDDALLYGEVAKFNKLFLQKRAVEEELKSRPGDRRRLLLRLYDHENAQVRLNAAKATLAVAPAAAREALENLANSKQFPQAGDAGMSLTNLDRGIYKPK